jgi:hypothetical protein
MARSWSERRRPLGIRIRNMKNGQRASLAALAANYTGAVALRVDSPPTEVRSDPLRWNRIEAFPRKTANLGQTLPRIHRALQALGLLCFGFCAALSHIGRQKEKPTARCFLAVGISADNYESLKSAIHLRQSTRMHNNNMHTCTPGEDC